MTNLSYTAPIASSAPVNDIHLFSTLIEYGSSDSIVAKAALKAIGRHMWYLNEELVPLSLFSHSVDNDIKKKMAEKILTYKSQEKCVNRFGTDYGKPEFPAIPTTTENDLSDFIGQVSLMFFTILKLDSSFLNHPVDDWINIESFKEAKKVVSNMCFDTFLLPPWLSFIAYH